MRQLFFWNRAVATKTAPLATALCRLDAASESAALREATLAADQRGVLALAMLEKAESPEPL